MSKKENLQQPLDLPDNLGFRLRRLREAQGLGLEDIADQLCLSASVIKAIELDQYTGKNNTVFMRGHVRAYARIVGLPSKEVQSTFIAMGLIEPPTPIESAKFDTIQHSAKDKPIRIVTYVIIILLVVLVLLWKYWN